MLPDIQNPSIYIKDQSLSLEVEEWLKHNEAKVIPRGVSTQTGYTRPALTNEPKTTSEPRPKTQPKPKVIKKAREYATVAEFNAWFNEFKAKLNYGDMTRFLKLAGVSSKVFNRAKTKPLTVERLAYLKLISLDFQPSEPKPKRQPKPKKKVAPKSKMAEHIANRKKALELGLDYFDGYCRVHGQVTMKIDGYRSKCPQCRSGNKPKFVYPSLRDRITYNQIKSKQEGNTFIGFCANHGEAVFGKAAGNKYYCKKCRFKNPDGKPPKKRGLGFKAKNTALKKEAIARGDKSFTGYCEKHGEAKYAIYGERCKCLMCSRAADRRRRGYDEKVKNNYAPLNRELMLAALEAEPNAKNFIGICVKHGEGIFFIKTAKNTKLGVTPACRACKLKL